MPYFTTAELGALPDMERFDSERLEAAHDWIVGVIERECGTSFVAETVTDEKVTGDGSLALRLSRPYVLSVTSVTVDGAAVATPGTTLYAEHGYLYYADGATGWTASTPRNVSVTYTAGYSAVPPTDLKEAAMRAARYWLLTGNDWSAADSRSTGISNEFGNITLSVAGEGRPTGLPDVDATIMAWARKVRVPAVA